MTTSMATYNTPKPRLTLPTVGLMSPDFVYVKCDSTDIRKTFARVRAAAATVPQSMCAFNDTYRDVRNDVEPRGASK